MRRCLLFFTLSLVCPSMVLADVPRGYSRVADEYGIPEILFYAVALQESERPNTNRPWPWTANVNGQGLYFETRKELFDHLDGLLEQGIDNFDVGPMEVNWHWNGHLFRSLWAATDPYTNLRVAALIIRNYFRQSRSYEDAIGRYHSPNDSEKAKKYKEKVRKKLAMIMEGER